MFCIIIFCISFSFNALLLFNLAIVLIYILFCLKKSQRSLGSYLKQIFLCADVIALPFLFWIYKKYYCPLNGFTAEFGYNVIKTDLDNYLNATNISIENILNRFASFFDNLFFPSILIATIFLILLYFKIFKNQTFFLNKNININNGAAVCFGIGFLLIVSSLFPYVAVDKPYVGFSYDSRFGILLNLSMAFLLVGIAVQSQVFCAPKNAKFFFLIVMGFCLFGIIESNRNYLRLSGYAAKQQSIVKKVKLFTLGMNDLSVVHLRESFQMPNTTHWVATVAWTYMFCEGKNLPRFLVVDSRNFISDSKYLNSKFPLLHFDASSIENTCWQSTTPNSLKNVSRYGKTLNLCVLEGSLGADAEKIGREYLFEKWFGTSLSMDYFLKRLTNVFAFQSNGECLEINQVKLLKN